MALDPLSHAQVLNFASNRQIGEVFIITWSLKDDRETKYTWKIRVVNIPFPGMFQFTTADAPDGDDSYQWEFPKLSDGVQKGPNDPITEDDVECFYWDLRQIHANTAARKSLTQQAKLQTLRSSIVAWKPSTWHNYLMGGQLGRDLVLKELFDQLKIPERINQSDFTEAWQHEACVLGEILISLVDHQLVVHQATSCQHFAKAQQHVVDRLLELKAGIGKKGDERSKVMKAFRTETLKEQYKGDHRALAFMGIPSGNPK